MNNLLKKILAFIGLVLLQAIVLNKVKLGGFVNPYVFPLFIVMIGFEVKNWVVLFIAFFLGLTIDLFNGTLGMHAFAMVLMAFLRPIFLKSFPPKTDKFNYPSLKENGFGWLLFYISTLLFFHHLVYFIIEAGSFNNFQYTSILTFLSLLMSVFISFLLIFTFNSEK